MTPAELEAIRARVDAATPGPWDEVGPCGICGSIHLNGRTRPVDHDGREQTATLADERFLAHARTDVPALLAHVAELREAWREYLSTQKVIDGAQWTDNYTDAARARTRQAAAVERARRILGEQP